MMIDGTIKITGNAVGSMLEDHMRFESRIVHSEKGLVEGISTLTLEADVFHAFGGIPEADGRGPEKKTFYLVAS